MDEGCKQNTTIGVKLRIVELIEKLTKRDFYEKTKKLVAWACSIHFDQEHERPGTWHWPQGSRENIALRSMEAAEPAAQQPRPAKSRPARAEHSRSAEHHQASGV